MRKPRVCLFCSDKDTIFIERLSDDLARKCQIDSWSYKYELRHEVPWLDALIVDGGAACDALILYITVSSLSSSVVSNEIDAGTLQRLTDRHVALLPYVDDAKLRSYLRPELQALQVPEWNHDNYGDLLPGAVARIWQSFSEQLTISAKPDQKPTPSGSRLAADPVQGDVFSEAEQAEFEFISRSFSGKVALDLCEDVWRPDQNLVVQTLVRSLRLDLSSLVAHLGELFTFDYDADILATEIEKEAVRLVGKAEDVRRLYTTRIPDIRDELLMHGLLEKFTYTSLVDGSQQLEHSFELTKKYFRYRFWLAFQHKLPDRIRLELVT